MNVIGKNIKKLRNERNVTQEQLAEELHISYQAVSKWETGGAVPDTMMLPGIAEFFGITIDELFKNNMVAYRHKGHRLASLYESSPTPENFAAAEAELLKVIENPTSQDQYFQAEDLRSLGYLYASHMYFCRDRAIDYYDRAIAAAESLRAHLYACFEQQKIDFLAQIGRGQESIDQYLTRIQSGEGNCEDYICGICACLHMEQYDSAYKLSQKALSIWADNVMLYKLSGDVRRALKKYDEAFIYWNKSLALNQKRSEETGENGFMDALFSMADCYDELGETEKASQTWKEISDRLEGMGFTIEKEQALERRKES